MTVLPCEPERLGQLTYLRLVLSALPSGKRVKLRYFVRREAEKRAREHGHAYLHPRLCRQTIESLRSRADVRLELVASPALLDVLHLSPLT